MRKAAGILLIIIGIASTVVPHEVELAIARTRDVSVPEFSSYAALASFILIFVILGGGICALKRKAYEWALTGAICAIASMIVYIVFTPLARGYYFVDPGALAGEAIFGVFLIAHGVLAVIFLVRSKGEFRVAKPSLPSGFEPVDDDT